MDDIDMSVVLFEDPFDNQEEIVCSRVKERNVLRLPLVATLMRLKQSKRERGRGRAAMLKGHRNKMEEVRPGSSQVSTDHARSTPSPDIAQATNLLLDSEFPALSIDDDSSSRKRLHSPSLHQSENHSTDMPHTVDTEPAGHSTAEEDVSSHTGSYKNANQNRRLSRPKVKAMDKQSFAAQHHNVLMEFSSMYGKTHHRPNRVMTLTKSNLERHSRDMDSENYHRIKAEIESGNDFVNPVEPHLRDSDINVPKYLKYQVTLDDIQKFKLHEKEVPSNVKGLLANLLFTDTQPYNGTNKDIANEDTIQRIGNINEVGHVEPHGASAEVDELSDEAVGTNDSMLSNLSDIDMQLDDTYQSDLNDNPAGDSHLSENAIADPWLEDNIEAIADPKSNDNSKSTADPRSNGKTITNSGEPCCNKSFDKTIVNSPKNHTDHETTVIDTHKSHANTLTEVDMGAIDRQHITVIDKENNEFRLIKSTGAEVDRQHITVKGGGNSENNLTGAMEKIGNDLVHRQSVEDEKAFAQCNKTVSAFERHLQPSSTEAKDTFFTEENETYSTEQIQTYSEDSTCEENIGTGAVCDGNKSRDERSENKRLHEENQGALCMDPHVYSGISSDHEQVDKNVNVNGTFYKKYSDNSSVSQLDDFDSDFKKVTNKKRNKQSSDSAYNKSKSREINSTNSEVSRFSVETNCEQSIQQECDANTYMGANRFSVIGVEQNGDILEQIHLHDNQITEQKQDKDCTRGSKSNWKTAEKNFHTKDNNEIDTDRLLNDSNEGEFQEVKHKPRRRKGSGKSPKHNVHKRIIESTQDNTVWRLYGPCVIQISGIPIGADVSVVMECVSWFGTVVDHQERHREDGCSVRVKFSAEEACDFAIENLHGSECLYPDAGCSLHCEKLKY